MMLRTPIRKLRHAPSLRAILVAATVCVACQSALAQQDTAALELRVNPSVGDTLRVLLTTDIRIDLGDSTGVVDSSHTNLIRQVIGLHTIVSRRDTLGAYAEVTRDSALGWSAPDSAPRTWIALSRHGRQALGTAQILTNGVVRQVAPAPGADSGVAIVSLASSVVLPKHAVLPGSTWEMSTHSQAGMDYYRHQRRKVRYVIRFDSLSPDRSRAYLSYAGTIESDSAAAPLAIATATEFEGAKFLVSGEVSGSLTLDRRRGIWSSVQTKRVLRAKYVEDPGSKWSLRAGLRGAFSQYELVTRLSLTPKSPEAGAPVH